MVASWSGRSSYGTILVLALALALAPPPFFVAQPRVAFLVPGPRRGYAPDGRVHSLCTLRIPVRCVRGGAVQAMNGV